MSLIVSGGNGGGLRSLVQWLVVGAVIGALLNSKDIQRYLQIRGM